jgi:hypothetical protein
MNYRSIHIIGIPLDATISGDILLRNQGTFYDVKSGSSKTGTKNMEVPKSFHGQFADFIYKMDS